MTPAGYPVTEVAITGMRWFGYWKRGAADVMSRGVGSQDHCCRLAVTRHGSGRLAERETPADCRAARSCAYVFALLRCRLLMLSMGTVRQNTARLFISLCFCGYIRLLRHAGLAF